MQRLLYLLIFPIIWLISILPLQILYLKSSVLYVLAYRIFRYRKKTVLGNLKLIFPEKTDLEIKSIAKSFYKHLCDFIFETIKTLSISEKALKKRYRYTNLELLDGYYDQNRSILLMCGHYANWEWSGILNKQMKYQGFGVYKKLDNPYFDKLVRRIRGKFGPIIVSNKHIAKTLYKYYKQGKPSMTLIVSDQTPKLGAFKYRDTFMNIDVPVFTGTEELAKMLDFTCLYMQVKKVKRGYYEATFVPLADYPKESPDFDITRKFLNQLEKQIYQEPSYYLWSHKRWKHRA